MLTETKSELVLEGLLAAGTTSVVTAIATTYFRPKLLEIHEAPALNLVRFKIGLHDQWPFPCFVRWPGGTVTMGRTDIAAPGHELAFSAEAERDGIFRATLHGMALVTRGADRADTRGLDTAKRPCSVCQELTCLRWYADGRHDSYDIPSCADHGGVTVTHRDKEPTPDATAPMVKA